MGLLDKIKNYWFPTVNPLTGGGDGVFRAELPQDVSRYIAKVQLQRIRQDIKSWRDAINEAELAYYPHRVQMQRLFQDTSLNGHVYACMEKRKSLTLMKKYQIVNEQGDVDEYWTKIVQSNVFKEIINYNLDALFYGYNLININAVVSNEIEKITLIKRHNISPDREQVVSYVYALQGIQFTTDEEYKDWCLWFTTPSETGVSKCGYGLLYRVAPYEIMLRNLLGYNGDFVELYSQPFRYAKTSKTTEDERGELANMMQNLGSSGWGIFDPLDEIGFLEAKNSGSGYQGYDNLEKRCEAKISKIILGHADAIDSTSGKLGSNNEVEEALEVIEKNDNEFIKHNFNTQILPKLRNLGITIPEGLFFEFCNDKEQEEHDQKERLSAKEIADTVKVLHDAGYKVDAAFIIEKTGIPLEAIEQTQALSSDVKNKITDLYGI